MVPGVLWTPKRTTASAALIATEHGGSQHKKSPNIRTRVMHEHKDFSPAPRQANRTIYEQGRKNQVLG